MNRFINYLSILAGRKFHRAYHENRLQHHAMGWLNVYIGLRQMLPKVKTIVDNNHYGNHWGSGFKPWKATQGF